MNEIEIDTQKVTHLKQLFNQLYGLNSVNNHLNLRVNILNAKGYSCNASFMIMFEFLFVNGTWVYFDSKFTQFFNINIRFYFIDKAIEGIMFMYEGDPPPRWASMKLGFMEFL